MEVPCVVGMLTEDCHRPILPQPPAPGQMRCKRRLHLANGLAYMVPQQQHSSAPHQQAPPTAVAKRNERERRRVRMVNLGFNALRQHVPNGAKNKKLSKVETLRSAIEYIRQLQDVVTDTDGSYDERNENFAPSSASPSSGDSAAAHYHHHLQQFGGLGFVVPSQQMYGHLPSNYVGPNSSGCSTASSPTPSFGSAESQSPAAADQFASSDEDILGLTWLAA